MKCAMYRLFHQLKGKVVIPLLFFMMILLPETLRKKLGGRRNHLPLPSLNTKRSCSREWARQKPLQPSAVELNTQLLFLVLKSKLNHLKGGPEVALSRKIL